MPKIPIKYKKEKCETCHQTTTYASKVNKGMARILGIVAATIRDKGENLIVLKHHIVDHKTREWKDPDLRLRCGKLTSTEYGNLTHLCRNGLLVRAGREVDPNTNKKVTVFLIPKKGWTFLRGGDVEAVAIIEKLTHKAIGYVADEGNNIYMTNIREVFGSKDGWWSGWDYDITSDGSLIQHSTQGAINV